MNKLNLQPLKGFRDFLPAESKKRQYVINTVRQVFELFGFEPLETPTLEYEEILIGKYGQEGDLLMYRFEDNGKRRVAMRYDQTVPLSRVVAKYQNELPLPFKRYQIQPVWRAENTQKGRFREFLQCDADIVGTESPTADAEVVVCAITALKKLGFQKFRILINDRKTFSDIDSKAIPIIDKLAKIGEETVKKLLREQGQDEGILEKVRQKQMSDDLKRMVELINKLGVDSSQVVYSPTLARGLDYYTGLIFEIEIEDYTAGSVCGGGRYDNLIGMFAGKQIPAVGFAFGFDRVIEAMEDLQLFPKELSGSSAKILITVFNTELFDNMLSLSSQLRNQEIPTELYPDPTVKLDKQLKYADKKGIPFAVIVGPDEVKNNQLVIKNLKENKQEKVDQNEFIKNPQRFIS
ncbi:MAG: Histidyl-tRNA synthetase [Candidatus Roizmanbacteria bacterium GW2011_GWA1_41_13]|uniref:Histidine--tRNA ligase n=1 Tax=Candidatus Roizmanbacteria bacterium GW2011_GWA1_41_13 TaxID=1618474 RepID=A0A0G0V068_9BACT|nr:MAG: Histidyl-tRNA synthetase [Candidatus Roizmanbacteria bacterium GW2011_GWA1_41_13]